MRLVGRRVGNSCAAGVGRGDSKPCPPSYHVLGACQAPASTGGKLVSYQLVLILPVTLLALPPSLPETESVSESLPRQFSD